MTDVRPFTDSDVHAVAAIFVKAFPEETGEASADVPEYLRDVFLRHPWRDDSLPSYVSHDADGRVTGFLGVVPRRMRWKGQLIRAVISLNLMVAAESRGSLAGVQLVKTLFQGPQDLTVTDGAGEMGRLLWEGLGGDTSLLYSLFWTRPVRPGRYALSLARKHGTPAPLVALASPVGSAIDALATRLPRSRLRLAPPASSEEAGLAQLLTCHREFSAGHDLRPDDDELTLRWLLERGAHLLGGGRMKKALVRNARHEIIGWYVYRLTDRRCSVIQVMGRKNTMADVLDVLFRDAWIDGAVAVTGRLVPEFSQAFSDRYCFLDRRGPWTQVHSRRPEILEAFSKGTAFFTRLEGEWALRYRSW